MLLSDRPPQQVAHALKLLFSDSHSCKRCTAQASACAEAAPAGGPRRAPARALCTAHGCDHPGRHSRGASVHHRHPELPVSGAVRMAAAGFSLHVSIGRQRSNMHQRALTVKGCACMERAGKCSSMFLQQKSCCHCCSTHLSWPQLPCVRACSFWPMSGACIACGWLRLDFFCAVLRCHETRFDTPTAQQLTAHTSFTRVYEF